MGGPTWVIYDDMPPFKLNEGRNIIYINVWGFTNKVVEILDNNPKYLIDCDFPWGHIWHES